MPHPPAAQVLLAVNAIDPCFARPRVRPVSRATSGKTPDRSGVPGIRVRHRGMFRASIVHRLLCHVRREIHYIGVNINQIARSVNAGIARPDDAKHGLYMLDRVYELMEALIEKSADE